MTIQDDETLKMYVEESLEHLADIENDLLAIEEAGADIDEELVNKVFRAAHSIKGGAGFMGLTNIKELSHKMENVLGMIRSREMVPNAEIINILLIASDSLRNLINNVNDSNEIDISGHIEALIALTVSSLPEEEKESVTRMVDISFPDGKAVFTVSEYDISNAKKTGKFIYLVEFDLIQDVHKKGKTPLDIIKEMQGSGIILESRIEIEAVGTLEDKVIAKQLPFLIIFASILEPDMINALFEINQKIYVLEEDLTARPVGEASAGEVSAFEKQETPPSVKEAMKKSDEIGAQESKEDIPASSPTVKDGPPPSLPFAKGAPGGGPGDRKERAMPATSAPETSLRVNISLLDSLMNLAGELVLGRNQMLQAINLNDSRTIGAAAQRLDLITTELQEAIMMTRMQPIGNVFNKFPRVVRDLSRNLGKEVELSIEGKGVELDKTIIEAISDPLTHLVRNSVDHGIEKPEDRKKSGKNAKGTVVLKAYHEAGQVNIEIADDGKGLDGDKLLAVALAKGLITDEQAKIMSEKEKVNLIFLPGFSTAEKVTDVSGRGVGMDVVKTNLDRLGGHVDIDSQPGDGTVIRIKLPLTLAIIPSQIISTGGERYAIPQVNMEELLRIPADKVRERIERVGDAEVVRLRGKLLPLLSLADVLGIQTTYVNPGDGEEKMDRRKAIADRRSRKRKIKTVKMPERSGDPLRNEVKAGKPENEGLKSSADDEQPVMVQNLQFTATGDRRRTSDRRYYAASAVNIVVVTAGSTKYGLVVDQLYDSEEIVVKPLGRHLKSCKGYAGATIMGDGRVALILDVAGLAQMAELTTVEGTERSMEVAEEGNTELKDDVQSLLVFRNAGEEQFAVPLNLVSRIQKIKSDAVEHVGGKKVIQTRGASLPLLALDEVANVKPLEEKEDLLVIVFLLAEKEIGLMATGPVDAMEVSAMFDDSTLKQPGIMGSAVIGNHTTLMVDIFDLIETANPDWFSEREAAQRPDGEAATILYAEDSRFFRNQVKGFLEGEGYNVIEAEDGMIAWNLLQEHVDEISLVLTDVEMPNLDGLGLATKIKGDERYSHLPVIAITTLAGEEEIERGKAAGVDDYQIKLDKEKLLEGIRMMLSR